MSDNKNELIVPNESEERTLLGNKDVVVMANSLIRSGQELLNIYEAKIVRLAIANIDKNDKELYTYTCTAPELAGYLGVDQKHIYSIINDLTSSLFGRVIRISDGTKDKKGNPNYTKINWVQRCDYSNGKVIITLSSQLKPYVIGLKSMFTMYLTENMMNLSTTNSIRLYELIMSWNNANRNPATLVENPDNPFLKDNELYFTIDFLRHFFGCDIISDRSGKPKYQNNANFIKRVIEKSVLEINEKMTVSGPLLDFEVVKKKGAGNKIAGVVFILLKRPTPTDKRTEGEAVAARKTRKKKKDEEKSEE